MEVVQIAAQFRQCCEALGSPLADPAHRQYADQWLTAFKQSPEAWEPLQRVVAAGGDGAVRLHAAQLLAWKVKKQLHQIEAAQDRAALAEAVTVALVAAAVHERAVARALSIALANLAIQCTDWVAPLDTVAPRLDQGTMLEFLTILPQECQDAAEAAHSASAEHGFGLRQRVREWGVEVAGWLRAVHEAAAGQQATELGSVRCFAAWVRWGCLPYIEQAHAEHFARAAAGLLLSQQPGLAPTGLDALSEVLEHATEALQPLLLQLALQLPPRVMQLAAGGQGMRDLAHVFSLFCSTHQALCVAAGPEGQALRQGLLQLLALPLAEGDAEEDGEGGGGAAVPAVQALQDAVEQLLAVGRGQEQDPGAPEPMDEPERRAFASSIIGVLLAQLQPFERALQEQQRSPLPASPGLSSGQRSPEGVPDALRSESEVLIDMCAELLGGDALVVQLLTFAEGAAHQHGLPSLQAMRALDACLCVLDAASGLFANHYHPSTKPAPAWFQGIMRLFGMVPQVDGSGQGGEVPVGVLQYDFLSSYTSLAPGIMPLLHTAPQQHQQALMQLVLREALWALGSQQKCADVAPGSTLDIINKAADAIRALCSLATASGFATSGDLLEAVEHALQLLQQPALEGAYQRAQQQLVVALVHAVHGIPPANAALVAQASAATQLYMFAPLAAALGQVQQCLAAAASPGGSPALRPDAVHAAAWRLQAALRRIQALLNAFESYADSYEHGSNPAAQAAARGVMAAAVGAFLSAWPLLSEACRASLPRDVYTEVAQSLGSCMALEKGAFEGALPSLADTAVACFFLPGGYALHRPLCGAIEAYGPQPRHQPLLLGAAAHILGAPQAQPMGQLCGGDADPELAQAFLSLAVCAFRQARQWSECPQPAALHPVLQAGLQLAVACAACNHRDTSQRALAVLSSLAALGLEQGNPLQPIVLGFVHQHGGALLQGVYLALLSFSSSANLPKVVGLATDIAALSAMCAVAQHSGNPAAVVEAALQLFAGWLEQAREGLVQTGALGRQAADSVLAQWDWQPVVQHAAAAQLNGSSNGNSSQVLGTLSAHEVRRTLQRWARQSADVLRRGAA